jgi:hypothetical protein
MNFARMRSMVVASLALVAGLVPMAWAGGVPAISWVVHDQTSGQVIEIPTPTGIVTLDGNHVFDVKLIVKDTGGASEVAIGGKIDHLQGPFAGPCLNAWRPQPPGRPPRQPSLSMATAFRCVPVPALALARRTL